MSLKCNMMQKKEKSLNHVIFKMFSSTIQKLILKLIVACKIQRPQFAPNWGEAAGCSGQLGASVSELQCRTPTTGDGDDGNSWTLCFVSLCAFLCCYNLLHPDLDTDPDCFVAERLSPPLLTDCLTSHYAGGSASCCRVPGHRRRSVRPPRRHRVRPHHTRPA